LKTFFDVGSALGSGTRVSREAPGWLIKVGKALPSDKGDGGEEIARRWRAERESQEQSAAEDEKVRQR
jgi:hypothetical protein